VVFHTSGWAAYTLAEHDNVTPEFHTMIADDGHVLGVALGFRARSARRFAAPFSGRRWLDALPAVRSDAAEDRSQFVSLLEARGRAANDVSLAVGSFASPQSEAVLAPLGFDTTRRLEFELSLDPPEDELWRGMEHKRRKNIKKAMRLGVQVRNLAVEEGIANLRRLQGESGRRIRSRGGPDSLHEASSGVDPIALLVRAGLGHLVGGFVDDRCVSASLFTTFNGLAYHTLSGHDDEALETQAPTLVLWEMLRRFRNEGIRRLNFGGCGIEALDPASPEHGVYTYKAAFGADRLECANGEKILRPIVGRVVALLKRALP
jgi:hypothetical protein